MDRFYRRISVFPCHYHSSNAPYSSTFNTVYRNDRRTKTGKPKKKSNNYLKLQRPTDKKINFTSFMQIQKFTNLVFAIRKDGKCLETIKIIVNVPRFQFPCQTKHYLPLPSLSHPAVSVALNTNASSSSQNMTQKASDTEEY